MDSNAAGTFPHNITNTTADPDATLKGPDPSNPTPFHFDDPGLNLMAYDEIWLFGFEGYDGDQIGPGPGEPGGLTDRELAAITKFMQSGGGVFATGDHDGLGSATCGRIPRVRYMRKWYSPNDKSPGIPPLKVVNWPGGGPTRVDTLQKSPTDIGNIFFFDDQSDDIPQPLTVLVPSHPVVQGATGVLKVYPDHMHEGEVIAPTGEQLTQTSASDSTLSFAGPGFTEFPAIGGYQEVPVVLAQNSVGTGGGLQGHITKVGEGAACEINNFSSDNDVCDVRPANNTLAAYDGHTVNVGRIVTDSSFHHFIDLNLLGDPCSNVAVKLQGFNASSSGKAVLAELDALYVNIATWLSRRQPMALWSSSDAVRVSWIGAANATSFDIAVIGDPGSTTNPHPVFTNVTSPFLVPIDTGPFEGWQSQYKIIAHGKPGQSSSTWSNVLGPPTLSLRIEPASVIGGSQNATGTVELGDTYIPPQGLQIGIAAYLPGLQPQSFVQVPTQVTVLPGSPPSASFPITTSVVPGLEDVEIQAYSPATALLGSAILQLTRQIPPGAIVAVSVAPDNVSFGDQATGYVFIAAPTSPQDVIVTFSSSEPTVAPVPDSVTVPAGQTSNSFPIAVASRDPKKRRFVSVLISGSAGGVTVDFELTVGSLPKATP